MKTLSFASTTVFDSGFHPENHVHFSLVNAPLLVQCQVIGSHQLRSINNSTSVTSDSAEYLHAENAEKIVSSVIAPYWCNQIDKHGSCW